MRAGGKMTRQLMSTSFFDEEAVFEKLIKTPGALKYAEVLQFTAFVRSPNTVAD